MTFAPVGIRCPEHANIGAVKPSPARTLQTMQRKGRALVAPATMVLIAINVVVYIVTAAQGGGINLPGGALFSQWALQGASVANGDWWRLVGAMFLHGSIFHLLFNMLALYWLGTIIEQALGTPRFLLVYFVSGLAGSAGALWFSSRVCGHGRRLRGDLRPHRRTAHPRVPRDRLADGPGDGADPRQPRVDVRRARHLDRRAHRRPRRRDRRDLRVDALPHAAEPCARLRAGGRRRRRQRPAGVRPRPRLRASEQAPARRRPAARPAPRRRCARPRPSFPRRSACSFSDLALQCSVPTRT